MDRQDYIEFRKTRDLGSIISDTFKFLGTEWKSFLGTILKVSIIPIAVAIAAAIYYSMSALTFIGNVSDTDYYSDFSFDLGNLFVPLLAFFLAYLVAYAQIAVSALSYIKSYVKNRGLINYEEVSNDTKSKFWSYVGLLFLNSIIIGIGTIFCFLPGIYFGVVLSVSMCILIFDNMSVGDSISDSFNFMKGHWWETFGVILIVMIISWIIGFVFNLPASFYQESKINFGLNPDPQLIGDLFLDPIYLIFLGFGVLINFILYMITLISTTFIYFDIKEKKYPSEYEDIIDTIGKE